MKRNKNRTMMALAVVSLMFLSSCKWTETDHYRMEWGPTTHMNIKVSVTQLLEDAREAFYYNNETVMGAAQFFCYAGRDYNRSITCLMKMLHYKIDLEGKYDYFWKQWTDPYNSSKYWDFHEAWGRARIDPRCLTNSFWFVDPLTSNWTYRNLGASECRR